MILLKLRLYEYVVVPRELEYYGTLHSHKLVSWYSLLWLRPVGFDWYSTFGLTVKPQLMMNDPCLSFSVCNALDALDAVTVTLTTGSKNQEDHVIIRMLSYDTKLQTSSCFIKYS